ncbi:MAG: EVE domain-containing protein [Sphingomonadaceae bacterium]|uniref:EVE domain-containing protein n=1 Tax=Thermaurantiacus sp. TaxID=2820283 RepID=UPI00298F1719|nr:EVE domain-containing protein [Thermaurantiacus sp.]MCS6986060.1 EVE domain-containing protein [Sphingomonadaceae bacterium]MDW8414724.1 EVE domain-containing protein [Thermaurantiacus sp.]
MRFWLLKSEPHVYSWDDLVRDGETVWDGVRNPQAAGYLKSMQVGDEALFYHSNVGKAAVGVCRITAEAGPDPTDPSGRWVAVRVAPVRALPHPVTLGEMKATPGLSALPLIRQPRLSVVPVSSAEWTAILKLAGAA